MKESLKNIFEFLIKNRIYNKELQTRYYSGIVKPQNNKAEKIVSLLYHTANTQSQPKIDNLASFYKKIYSNKVSLNSFKGFLSVINPQKENDLAETLSLYILATRKHQVHINIDQYVKRRFDELKFSYRECYYRDHESDARSAAECQHSDIKGSNHSIGEG